MQQPINFKTKNYFEGVVYALGWVFGIIALGLLLTNWYVAPIFGFLAFMILTAKYKLTIDTNSREIEDYLHIIGLKTQTEKFRYSTLEYIYITSSKYTQQMNMQSLSSTISGEIYNADLENHFIGESKDLSELKEKIKRLAEQLELEINIHSSLFNIFQSRSSRPLTT